MPATQRRGGGGAASVACFGKAELLVLDLVVLGRYGGRVGTAITIVCRYLPRFAVLVPSQTWSEHTRRLIYMSVRFAATTAYAATIVAN